MVMKNTVIYVLYMTMDTIVSFLYASEDFKSWIFLSSRFEKKVVFNANLPPEDGITDEIG